MVELRCCVTQRESCSACGRLQGPWVCLSPADPVKGAPSKDLKGWRDSPRLALLNLKYDAMPAGEAPGGHALSHHSTCSRAAVDGDSTAPDLT